MEGKDRIGELVIAEVKSPEVLERAKGSERKSLLRARKRRLKLRERESRMELMIRSGTSKSRQERRGGQSDQGPGTRIAKD